MSYDRINKLHTTLKPYIEADGTEVGDYLEFLRDLGRMANYHSKSEQFMAAIIDELEAQLQYFQTYSKIITREETQTRTVAITELEWYEDAPDE